MLFADLVATSAAVAATRARTAKTAALVELLQRLEPDEVEAAVGFLTGCAAPGSDRRRVAHRPTGSRPSRRPTPTAHDPRGRRDRRHPGRHVGRRVGGRPPGTARRAVRASHRSRGRLRPPALHRWRAPGRARRRDDRRGGQGGRPPARLGAASRHALGRPRPHRASLALHGGAEAIDAVHLAVLNPIQPMLAASAADVAEALGFTGPASVEWKLDGARVQVHRRGDEVRIYTRNLNDVTNRLPGRGRPAPWPCRRRDFVLDGEVLWFDEDAKPQPFQDTMSAFGSDDRRPPPTGLLVRFFDVLHVDGTDVIEEPLTAAASAASTRWSATWPSPAPTPTTPRWPRTALDVALAAGHEGVMVKALTSTVRRRAAGRVLAQGEAGAARSTSWCSAPSGATVAARAGCPTSTSGPGTPTAAS